MKRYRFVPVMLLMWVAPALHAGEGQASYQRSCAACHDAGVLGAPRLGDRQAWGARIAKGRVVLNRHALEGFQGQGGYMPPRGGDPTLSDEEVAQAVQYMIDQGW